VSLHGYIKTKTKHGNPHNTETFATDQGLLFSRNVFRFELKTNFVPEKCLILNRY